MNDTLSGALHLRWTPKGPQLRSTRRDWARRLGPGRMADALPALLGGVYTVCGGAHRLVAQQAVMAARGTPSGSTPAERRALQDDTIRAHLRWLWLDAAALLPAAQRPDPRALQRAPLTWDTQGHDWMVREVLGMPAQDWWTAWQSDPEGFVDDWTRRTDTWPARWLAAGRRALAGLRLPVRGLVVPQGPHAARLADAWLAPDATPDRAPACEAAPAETGPWTRQAALADPASLQPLSMRLAARVAELARWVLEPAAGAGNEPALGAIALPQHTGLAWGETARGLLLHVVRLTPADRVLDCAIAAPTDWNFHPEGAAREAFSALPGSRTNPGLPWITATYDPCVPLIVDAPALEIAHA